MAKNRREKMEGMKRGLLVGFLFSALFLLLVPALADAPFPGYFEVIPPASQPPPAVTVRT
jgi:hypothetical protein